MKSGRLVRFASALTFAALPLLAAPLPEDLYREMRWRMIGPARGGRTRAVAGVHGNPDILYIGATNGGVWKSDDYGRIWTPIFDDQPTQSIGAIAVAPSATNVVYVATGEGLQRPDLSVGNGVYRSNDSGRTWTHLGLRDGQQIPAIAVNPRNPNYLFAAVLGHPYGPNEERGIYRSTDGAKSWTKVLGIDASTGGSDVDIDPSNPDVVYAAMWQGRQGPWEDGNSYGGEKGGIYKSTDGGTTWTQLAGGLPPKIVQANVAIAPSNPKRLYAVLATSMRDSYESADGLGLYRSDDAGASWKLVTDDPRPVMRIGGGDLPVLGVDPKNEDVLYSTSIVTFKSSDGGKTWMSLRGAPGGDDYQNIWIDPADPNVILLASDQGAVVSVNGGSTWSSWYNQPTAQLYHVQASNTFPYYVCSGQQESGSVCISTRGEGGAITYREWRPVGASEYGYAAPDPLDGDIVYGAGRNEVTKYHWSTAQTQNVSPIPILGTEYRVDRTQPIVFSPADPHVLYYAANVVFSTRDGGTTWAKISSDLARKEAAIPPSVAEFAAKDRRALAQRGVVYALAPSFKTDKTLWAGTDDGLVWITRDGGANWQNVTPPGVEPWSKVTQIAASPFDDATSYVSVSRFRVDDLRPYVYRTRDGGKSWTLITTGLPNGPVNSVREDLKRKGLLFSATENAVFVSFDDGNDWQPLTLNLPHTSMRDLWIHENDLIVATHGRSFWVLDDLAPLRQANAEIAKKAMFLFDPSPAVRVRRSVYPDTPIPADEPRGENPPSGAIIDYYVGHQLLGPITLEIIDTKGQVVRRYSSGDGPDLGEEELRKQTIPTYWMRPFHSLPSTPGMHRWLWDLRYEAPGSLSRRYPISAVPHDTPRVPEGPLVLPGEYTVRLSAGDAVATASVQVKADPRMKMPASDLQRQVALERKIASMMTSSARATKEARAVAEQLAKSGARGAVAKSAKALEARVRALLGTPGERPAPNSPEPLDRLAGEAASLYAEVGQSDAAPTSAQSEAAANVERELKRSIARWNEVMTGVRAFNAKVRAAAAP